MAMLGQEPLCYGINDYDGVAFNLGLPRGFPEKDAKITGLWSGEQPKNGALSDGQNFPQHPVPILGLTSLLTAGAAASGLRSGVRFSCAASQDRWK